MSDNEVSCFTSLRKTLMKWRFNGNTKVIKSKSDKSIDRSDTKIQLLLYNDKNNNSPNTSSTPNIKIGSEVYGTIKVPISFHADMELSPSQSEHPNCSVVNRDKAGEEIEFKEHKSVSIEIGSNGNKHSISHGSSESIESEVVLREKRHKRDEKMDYNDTSEHKYINEQVKNKSE